MPTLRWALVAAATSLLVYGLSGIALAQVDPESGFPTGTFVANEDPDLSVEFREDGTYRWLFHRTRDEIVGRYATNDDLYTQMTREVWDPTPNTPATYYWDWDGETLTFELWGDDTYPAREARHTGLAYRLVPDAMEVVVARRDALAGYVVAPILRYVSAADAAGAFIDLLDVKGLKATVDIAEGAPITPDLLEPSTQ